MSDLIQFFQRTFPSANMVLIHGERPILVDTGYGSDLSSTESLLRDAGVPPEQVSLVLNTHYHSDHVGGNYGLQTRYDLPVAASRLEASLVNRRAPDVCSAVWLDQPIEPYTVERPLDDGDVIETGAVALHVVATPGHTLGHISLYAPEQAVLIAGDAVHSDDVAWMNIFREGAGALERALSTLDRLAQLEPRCMYSGHGPATASPLKAIDSARRRYNRWLSNPERVGWHACKRIFSYALMIYGGMDAATAKAYLLRCPWFQDYSRFVFNTEPADFVGPLFNEMERSGAAVWQDGVLVAGAPYTPPQPGWASAPTRIAEWP